MTIHDSRSHRGYWVLILSIFVFSATLLYTLYLSLKYNRFELIYATEDNYIHLAMAKNLAMHGNWSVDIKNFTSSSSSLLWLLLLSSTYVIFGVNKFSPLVLNSLFGLLVILSSFLILKKYNVRNILILCGLVSIIFFTPLVPLIFSGQEHTMHIFLTLIYVYLSVKILCSTTQSSYKLLLILTPLMTMARYESLFLIFVVAVLLAIRRNFRPAILIMLAGILPVIVYGIFSVSKGWYFLPNSILLKGQVPDLSTFNGILNFIGLAGIKQMISVLPVLLLVISSAIILISSLRRPSKFRIDYKVMIVIFIAITFLHMQFARTGSFYRYEAYIIALGIFVITLGIDRILPEHLSVNAFRKKLLSYILLGISICILLFPLYKRAVNSLLITPKATVNIFQQQYQMGLFLKQFYQGESVAANDIGAINYLSDVECLDLAGLGSLEIAAMMRDGSLSREKIYELAKAKNVKVAIVYDHWFTAYGGLPEQWKKVGEWTITHNVIVAGNTVSFYAVDTLETNNLINNLKTFSSSLPKDVIQSGKYLESLY